LFTGLFIFLFFSKEEISAVLSYIVWVRAQALAFHSIDVTQSSGGSADAIVCGQGEKKERKEDAGYMHKSNGSSGQVTSFSK
jgi:hypothetical protein